MTGQFKAPQSVRDAELLWEQAPPLSEAELPDWLPNESAWYYRRVAVPAPTAGLEALESRGWIVERSPESESVVRVYMPRPEDNWSIGLYAGSRLDALGADPNVCNPIISRDHVDDAQASFVADPFMVKAAGKWNLFFEVMRWDVNKGEIGLAVSTDTRTWTYCGIVLAESFHLSYPYVFEWSGDHYMVPESHQCGAVRLYRAVRFPEEWVYDCDLITGPYLVDASPFFHRDSWWMMVETGPDARNDTLRLYRADALRGPWREHPASPLVSGDPAGARPAGRITGTPLPIRVAQVCVPTYGERVQAYEVTELSATAYSERPLGAGTLLAPSNRSAWNGAGMHHIDAHRVRGGWIACIDGRSSRRDDESLVSPHA